MNIKLSSIRYLYQLNNQISFANQCVEAEKLNKFVFSYYKCSSINLISDVPFLHLSTCFYGVLNLENLIAIFNLFNEAITYNFMSKSVFSNG